MNIQILKKNSKKGFKKLIGINRDTAPAHISKLKDSIVQLGMLQAIIVARLTFITGKAEDYIIEGQHKYEACMALGIDIPYTTINNISNYEELINTIALLNSSSKSWTLSDYILAWSSLYPDYKKLMVYSNQFDVEIGFTASILAGLATNSLPGNLIRKGTFRIVDEESNLTIVKYLAEVIKVLPRLARANSKNFVSAYTNMLRNMGEKYNHKSFMGFLSKNKESIVVATNSSGEMANFLKPYLKFALKEEQQQLVVL